MADPPEPETPSPAPLPPNPTPPSPQLALPPDQSHFGPHQPPKDRRYQLILSLTALGIVYGDIGTSPLYAIREAFLEEHGVAAAPGAIMGVLSLIFWSLILVISVKYLVFILRADNRGEGGILALTSLVTPAHALRPGRKGLIILGLFGTSLASMNCSRMFAIASPGRSTNSGMFAARSDDVKRSSRTGGVSLPSSSMWVRKSWV
jgi:hypothetical protein